MLTICVEEDWVLDGKKVVLLKPVEEVDVSELTKELTRLSSENRELREENKKLKDKNKYFHITINNNGRCDDKATAEKVSKEIERILSKQYNQKEKRKILKEEYRNKALEPMIHQEWEMLADVFDVKRSKNEDYSDWTERIKFAMYG